METWITTHINEDLERNHTEPDQGDLKGFV